MSVQEMTTQGRSTRAQAKAAHAEHAEQAGKREQREQAQQAELPLANDRIWADAVLSASALRTLNSAATSAWVLLGISGGAALPALIMASNSGPTTSKALVALVMVLVLLPATAFAWLWHARRRYTTLRTTRSYRVTGYQPSLDSARSHPSTSVDVRFVSALPEHRRLREVFTCQAGRTIVEANVACCEVEDGAPTRLAW